MYQPRLGHSVEPETMSDDEFKLTRRNALIGLGTVGAASAGAGLGTSAYFSDDVQFDGNTIQAGEFGLTVEQQVHEINQDGIGPDEEEFDAAVGDDGLWVQDTVTIEDAKPGDEYEFCWDITVHDNPGYVALAACCSDLNGSEAGNVSVDDLWDIDDVNELSTIGEETLVDSVTLENGDRVSYSYDTVADLLADLKDGAVLDHEGGAVTFEPGVTWTLCVALSIPGEEVGNELQGAMLEWDLAFYAEQARHNDGGGVADRAAANLDCDVEDDPADCPEETTWDEIGDVDEAGGPVILMGMDSELNPMGDSHGPPEDHRDMFDSLLGDVTNDGEGMLVLGGNPDNNSDIEEYWTDVLGEELPSGESVDYVNDISEMETVDFDGYRVLGIVSSTEQINRGLTNAQNDVLDDRSGDIAAFVNDGGGLLGKTQEQLSDPWAYVDPFGNFENRDMGFDQYSTVEVQQAGLDLGLTQDGMSGWCCHHETFPEYPDFFEVLYTRDESGSGDGEAGGLGGDQVVVEREVSLEISGIDTIETDKQECYDVEVTNQGTEDIENATFEINVVSGDGHVTTPALPDTVTLGPDDSESWNEAICVGCEMAGTTEIEIRLVGNDGVLLVDVTMEIACVEEIPEDC